MILDEPFKSVLVVGERRVTVGSDDATGVFDQLPAEPVNTTSRAYVIYKRFDAKYETERQRYSGVIQVLLQRYGKYTSCPSSYRMLRITTELNGT